MDDYVPVCPKCGSSDTDVDMSIPAAVATGLFDNRKVCNNCGNSGVFPEVQREYVPDKPLNSDEIKDREMIDTRYGRGMWKIAAVFVSITLVILLLSWII